MPLITASRQPGLLFTCALLSAAVLAFDLNLPLGVAGGVPYVLVVLLALRIEDDRATYAFAILGTLLTLVGLLLSTPQGIYWMVLANRALALFAIWVTALLGLGMKRTARRLQESEGRFQLLADQAPVMIWRADANGDWNFVSAGWRDFTGGSDTSELGLGWLQCVHANDREAVADAYREAVERHTQFRAECRLQHTSGTPRRVVLHGAPSLLDDGSYAGLVGTGLDVHEQRQIQRSLNETLQKSFHREKMSTLGMLTARLLHEINNPVTALAGLVQALLDDLDRPDGETGALAGLRRDYLQLASTEVERLARLTREAGSVSALSGGESELGDLNRLVERICWLVSHDDRMAHVTLDLQLDRTLPAVPLVSDLLIQLLLNLLSNAIDACTDGRDGGCITVSSRFVAGRAVLEVADNGVGMSPEVLARAGEPYFTTKPDAAGLGLGLALCRSLADDLKAELEIESEPGRGTHVRVVFQPPSPGGE